MPMNDAEFLDFCQFGAPTSRFTKAHIERLSRLAGVEIQPPVAADLRDGTLYGWPDACELARKARKRIASIWATSIPTPEGMAPYTPRHGGLEQSPVQLAELLGTSLAAAFADMNAPGRIEVHWRFADGRDGKVSGWQFQTSDHDLIEEAYAAATAMRHLAAIGGPFRSPLDTLPPADAARWRETEAACRAWPRTREQPHPPIPEVVQYVVKAGERVVLGDNVVCVLTKPAVLDWPPTERSVTGGSVAYHVVPTDLRLFEHLYNLGLLTAPAGETVDNRKAPAA